MACPGEGGGANGLWGDSQLKGGPEAGRPEVGRKILAVSIKHTWKVAGGLDITPLPDLDRLLHV